MISTDMAALRHVRRAPTLTDRPRGRTVYPRRAACLTRKPHQAWGFKTIFRREAPFGSLRRPPPATARHCRTCPDGPTAPANRCPTVMLEQRLALRHRLLGLRPCVTLNHYATRSCESFLVKRDRGRTNHVARPQGFDYWNTYNRNDEDGQPRSSRASPSAHGLRQRLRSRPDPRAACTTAR